MHTSRRSTRSRPRNTRRRFAPGVEGVESRTLLTAGAGFLAGSVLLEGAQGGAVPGVTVELFKAGSATPLAVSATGANGQYLFTGLQPGDYLLKEVAPAGYLASGTQVLSQLNHASTASADTIKVTVADPARVFVNYGGVIAGGFVNANLQVNGAPEVNSTGPFQDTLGTSPNATDLNAGFHTFCVNDLQNLNQAGGQQYQVTPRPINELTNGNGTVSADHAGRIAYLFNHHGQAALTDVQGAGLQFAIWELQYDAGKTPDFTAGNFQVVSPYAPADPATLAAAVQQAAAYFNESAGHDEAAVFLDAAAANPGQVDGLQSVLATGSLDFTLHKAGCGLKNVSYVVNGWTRVTDLRGHVHAGDTVEADFTVPAGQTETLSLVSYTAPQADFDAATASQQKVFRAETHTFTAGAHSLKVAVPCGNFQVDFVCGDVITTFGPAGSNNFYTPQGRLISADNGGPAATPAPCPTPAPGPSCGKDREGAEGCGDRGGPDFDGSKSAFLDELRDFVARNPWVKACGTGADWATIFRKAFPRWSC